MGCEKGSEAARKRHEIAMRTECRGCRAEGDVVHWRGMRWLGYPWPKRLVLAVRAAWAECLAGNDPQPAFAWRLSRDYLPGCGCLKWLKELLGRYEGSAIAMYQRPMKKSAAETTPSSGKKNASGKQTRAPTKRFLPT